MRLLIFFLLLSVASYGQILIDPTASPTTSRINDGISDAYVASGTDTYTVTAVGTFNYTYLNGHAVSITFTNPNTGAATLDFDGLGVKDIQKWSGGSLVALSAGDLTGTVRIRYDGTRWVTEGGVGSGGGMVYPGAGIALSTGSAWGTSITDNSAVWNTAITTATGTQNLTGDKIIGGAHNLELGTTSNGLGKFSIYTQNIPAGLDGQINIASENSFSTSKSELVLTSSSGLLRTTAGSAASSVQTASTAVTVSGSDDVRLATNSTIRFRINSTGAFGLGSSPDYGTSGYVLTSQGSATLPTWAAPATDATKLPLIGAAYTTTTGNGLDITSSTVTSGNLVSITNTGTAAASDTKTALYVASSGANGTSGEDTYAARFSNTGTGTASKNVGVYATASGGTTNNAIETLGNVFVNTGNLTVATASGTNSMIVGGSAHIQLGSQFGNGLHLRNTADNITYQSATNVTLSGYSMSNASPAVRLSSHTTSTATSGNITMVSLQNKQATSLFSWASGTAVGRVLAIDPTYNITGGTSTVYGIDYNPTLTSITGVTHLALRATEGQVVIGATGTSSANDRVKINGVDDTTGKIIVANNNSGTERFSVQGNGAIAVSGDEGTSGYVLTSAGAGTPPTWSAPSVRTTTTKTATETVVRHMGVLGASNTGSSSIQVNAYYGNSTTLIADITVYAIKSDGSASVVGKVTGRYRKNSSGTFAVDDAGTAVISDVTVLASIVPEINGTNPQVQVNTGVSGANYDFSFTAVCSYITY